MSVNGDDFTITDDKTKDIVYQCFHYSSDKLSWVGFDVLLNTLQDILETIFAANLLTDAKHLKTKHN